MPFVDLMYNIKYNMRINKTHLIKFIRYHNIKLGTKQRPQTGLKKPRHHRALPMKHSPE